MEADVVTLPHLEKLPDEFLRAIGDISVAWSLQELALRRTIFAMLKLSEARGRTAVRTPRGREMVEMIQELALIDGFTVNTSGLKLIDQVESRRNLVVHGIWFDGGNGKVLLQDMQGSWPKTAKRPAFKKRILPAGVPITADDLIDLAAAIRTLTLNTYDVAQAIAKRLATSQQTHPAPSRALASRAQDGPT